MNQSANIYPVKPEFAAKSRITRERYEQDYAESVAQPEAFWGRVGQRLDWMRAPTKIKDVSYDLNHFRIHWYADGELNASVNCLDRHLATRGDKTALIFEPDSPDQSAQQITYRDLHARVCRLANALRGLGVVKGDRVTIYLPMIPEAVVAMLACARIGAIHSIVFAGFSPDALANRINDSEAKVLITADFAPRGGKKTPFGQSRSAWIVGIALLTPNSLAS